MEKTHINNAAETGTVKPKVAALLRGYWLSQRGSKTPVRLDEESHKSARAGAHIFWEGQADVLAITIGEVWGPEYDSVANLMAKELTEVYKVPPGAVKVLPPTLNSNTETEESLKFAEREQIPKLIDVASHDHHWTVKRMYSEGCNVEFMSIEKILNESNQVSQVVTKEGSDELDQDELQKAREKLAKFLEVSEVTGSDIPPAFDREQEYVRTYLTTSAHPDTRVLKFMQKSKWSKIKAGRLLYNGIKLAIVLLGRQDILARRLDPENNKKSPVFFGDRIGLKMSNYALKYNAKKAEARKRRGYQYTIAHRQALARRKLEIN